MHNVTVFLNYLADHWTTIVMYITASGLLSPVMLAVKHFITKVVGKPTELQMFLIVYFGAVGIAIGHYLLQLKTTNPTVTLVQGAILTVLSQPFYFKLVKPLGVWLTQRVKEAEQLRKDAAAAIVPPEGMPLQPEPDTTFQG